MKCYFWPGKISEFQMAHAKSAYFFITPAFATFASRFYIDPKYIHEK